MFHPSEVELGETTRTILEEVERIKPTRVVFDSLSELRLLAGNSLRYRRQILTLKQFFSGRHRSEEHTSELQSLMRISYAVFCLKKKKANLLISTHQTSTVYAHMSLTRNN